MKRRGFAAIAFLATGLYGQALPDPVITSISPSSVIAGSPTFTLTVTGTGFQRVAVGAGYLSTSQVRWNGVALFTNYLNTTQRTATIDASLVASAGTATVDVVNPGPVVSNAVVFTIVAPLGITTSSPLPSGLAGSAYFLALGATGGTGSRTWLVVSGTPPAGLTLSPGSGTITGIPTTPGAYRFRVRVTDSVGVFTERTFDVNIAQNGSTQGPDGQVGVPYTVTALALSGTPPWTWQHTGGQLPPGLTLNSTTGQISGTPTTAGTFLFSLMWTDSQELTFNNSFSIRILPPVLTITTNSPLPNATAGASYSQTFAVAGGSSPYTWSSTGALPPGLALNAAGVLSGTPTQGGTFNFTVRVADSSESFTSKAFSLTVTVAALAITTDPSLPSATAGLAYSQAFAATGGIPPYTWSVPPGALQPGLTLSAAGLLSGTPTQGGTSNFTVRVADVSGSIATKTFTLTVAVPQTTLAATGLTDIVTPAEQPSFDVRLSEAYPLTITGTVTLTFHQNAIYPSDDPAIQFSTGGRTMNFTIPAGQISAFPTTLPSIQTGTVAGRIDLTLNYFAGGQNITPANQPVRAITIARSAPKITSVEVVKVAGGFNILVRGFSTPRQITQADFTFTPAAGGELETTHVTVIADSAFTTWYAGTTSPLYGSLFLYTQPFTVQGNVSDIGSVSVTLAHTTGTSAAVSASF